MQCYLFAACMSYIHSLANAPNFIESYDRAFSLKEKVCNCAIFTKGIKSL